MDVLIRMNTRILGGWLGSKISAGQSGGGIAFRTIRPISLFFNTKHIYLFMSLFSYAFRFLLTKLFIYSLNYLFLNFWYFFIHEFNWFPQSKISCGFECSFCSFTVRVCLWLICMFVCIFNCTLFVHAASLFKTCICLYLCWSAYVYICVFLYLQYCVNVSV